MRLFRYATPVWRAAVLGWAGAAELAWHLAGHAWAFTTVLAAFIWLAGTVRAWMAADTAKVYNLAQRVDGIAETYLPLSGGSITGDLHIGGDLYGASGVLQVGDSVSFNGGSITVHGNFWLGSGPTQIKTVAQPTGAWQTAPGTYSQSWGQNADDVINNINSKLATSGLFT